MVSVQAVAGQVGSLFDKNAGVITTLEPASYELTLANDRSWRAPCKGGAFLAGESPTRRHAPAGSNRSGHGGNEMAEAVGWRATECSGSASVKAVT